MMLAGNLQNAVPLLEEALAAARETGDIFQVMDNLFRVAEGRRLLGDFDHARSAALEALDIVDGGDIEGWIAAVLQLLSAVETAAGRHRRAMRLYGAAQSIADSLGGDSLPATVENPVQESRTVTGARAAEEALAEGRAMTRAGAVAYARTTDR
jgi:tetratricopeptide (TPR) repeat protein